MLHYLSQENWIDIIWTEELSTHVSVCDMSVAAEFLGQSILNCKTASWPKGVISTFLSWYNIIHSPVSTKLINSWKQVCYIYFTIYEKHLMWSKGKAPMGMYVDAATLENVWRCLKKLKIELPYYSAIPLLGIYLEKTINQKDTSTPMFTAALFTRATSIYKTWKQHKCP